MDSIAELIHYDCVYLWGNVEGGEGGGGLGHTIKNTLTMFPGNIEFVRPLSSISPRAIFHPCCVALMGKGLE